MSADVRKFPIVGIGASAGGIPALEGFFKGLGSSEAMAIVIVTHLNPDRASLLPEVVARHTDASVLPARDGDQPEPGHVYVMPENAVLTMANGRFELRRPDPANRERKPIDTFLSSLAREWGEHAAAIILSGGDGDGTLGIKAIKERGGLTLAQIADGDGPRNPDMPDTAIKTGLVDFPLPVSEMGAKLHQFAHLFETLDELESEEVDTDAGIRAQTDAIHALLLNQTGHDFSGYKNKTFVRRVRRRMQILQVQTLEDYAGRLRSDPAEVTNLFRDLLINVTSFFRDDGAFDALGQLVIPRLFEGKGAGDTIRVWVPGCATGEEVYSLGILMLEHMSTLTVAPRVQIFATDIDETALSVARMGRYPEALLEGLSEERRARFFVSDGASFIVAKQVREMCIFSPHSVIRDPPFSRMDLVSCRNLLIYFGADIQNQVIPTFHYALRPGGYLFLGTSESTSQHAQLFVALDKKHRIFQARENASHTMRLPATLSSGRAAGSQHRLDGASSGIALRQAVEGHILEHFAPPYVVVNGDGDMVFFSARTGRFLEAPAGAPSRQLLASARKDLRLDLRACLREAADSGRTAQREHVAMEESDERIQEVTLTVQPMPDRGQSERLYLVLFTPEGPPRSRAEADSRPLLDRDAAIAELEGDLRETRERLQGTIEEYETALEELKSSNEELVSVNEEAQSTNEELEASKEEMQSLNEELHTINAELSTKVEELDHANNDLRNLFESTQIATVFLDRNLVIRSFTPAASSFFRLRNADMGRPLTDLAGYLEYPELKDDIRRVFENGKRVEHHSTILKDQAHYLARLMPYRGPEGKSRGLS
jgi:two-component system CheB/CheR fusion protein